MVAGEMDGMQGESARFRGMKGNLHVSAESGAALADSLCPGVEEGVFLQRTSRASRSHLHAGAERSAAPDPAPDHRRRRLRRAAPHAVSTHSATHTPAGSGTAAARLAQSSGSTAPSGPALNPKFAARRLKF